MVKWRESPIWRARFIAAALFLLACVSPIASWWLGRPKLGPYAFGLLLSGSVIYAVLAELERLHAEITDLKLRFVPEDGDASKPGLASKRKRLRL